MVRHRILEQQAQGAPHRGQEIRRKNMGNCAAEKAPIIPAEKCHTKIDVPVVVNPAIFRLNDMSASERGGSGRLRIGSELHVCTGQSTGRVYVKWYLTENWSPFLLHFCRHSGSVDGINQSGPGTVGAIPGPVRQIPMREALTCSILLSCAARQ